MNKQEQIRQYLDQTFAFLNSNNRRIITNKRREQAYNTFLNSSKSEEEIKKEIDEIRDRLLKEYEELQKKIQEMVSKEERKYTEKEQQSLEEKNPNKPIEIKKINISDMSYDNLDKMFFHYTWKHHFYSINENGLQSRIGENSKGIDKEPSIFFSGGVEAALQTWDVWLKFRLDRINNPYYQGKTEEEIEQLQEQFKNGEVAKEQYYEYEKWVEELLSEKYKQNPELLQELFEYQLTELKHSIYLSFDLKEGQDYMLDQIDHRKEKQLSSNDNNSQGYNIFRVMRGAYSDYSTPIMDKWNMHTIPGKEITIPASEIVQLTTSDGKEDVWSILNEFYTLYKTSVPKEQQTKFDLLDSFMSYTRKKLEPQKKEELRQAREKIKFDDEFELKKIDENGNVTTERQTVTTNGIKAGKGFNAPLIVSYSGTKGYYKNSINTSTSSYDNFEYIICSLGKKLGISMAETYKLYQNGTDMGIISEGIDKSGDIRYDTSDVIKLMNGNPDNFPIDVNGLKDVAKEYASLRNPDTIKTFKDEKDKSIEHEYAVLKTPEDIEKAVLGFPKIVSQLQIPEEQKKDIEQNYYNMVMLDLITGNVDRNTNNYGIVQRADGKIEFSPLFDNSTIVIPHLPENLTQINGYLMDKDMLLDCLFQNHYDSISHITTKLAEHEDEYKQYLETTCERELETSDKDWFLDGHLLPQLDKVCEREKQHNFEQNNVDEKKTEMVEWTEINSPQQEMQQSAMEQSHDNINTFVEVSQPQANQTQALGNGMGQTSMGGMSNGISNSEPSNSGPSMSSSGLHR